MWFVCTKVPAKLTNAQTFTSDQVAAVAVIAPAEESLKADQVDTVRLEHLKI